ncbi:MAG: 1-acyl-sn-glycerol-3-phosphate acyltransferase, partial [Vicinamibacterales bacterium]
KAGDGLTDLEARERIHAYLDELRTTQRYPIDRALKHPLYPILRKIDRVSERVDVPADATASSRVLYISNHRSHLDYLVEPLILDDNGIRPPVIAAGINLFGGPLGLIHRHVTGAIPIRRGAKDPAYLVTLKAYIAETLKRHDLMFYLEGGRSYSGELKSPKTGILNASVQSERRDLVIVPVAIAYDLVLEDKILSRQGQKRVQRPFSRELAEMVGAAVGYQSRACVTFGTPIPLQGWNTESRRDILKLAHLVLATIGRLYKVLPTALVAHAMRPSMTRRELMVAIDPLVDTLQQQDANLETADLGGIADVGVALLEARGILVQDRQLIRVRDRHALRYYARSIEHLLQASRRDRMH